jgi:hypothetical protein
MNSGLWIRSGKYGISGPHSITQMKSGSNVLVNANSYIASQPRGPFHPIKARFPDPSRLFVSHVEVRRVSFKYGIDIK